MNRRIKNALLFRVISPNISSVKRLTQLIVHRWSVCKSVPEMVDGSPMSSVCSSDEADDLDVSAGQKSSPDSRSEDIHPLNLTKRKDRISVNGTHTEGTSSSSPLIPSACSSVGPECRTCRSKPASFRPSSFSLKTSPSKFLSTPSDDHGESKTHLPVDGWSQLTLGRQARPSVQSVFDNNSASMMLSSSASLPDRVKP